MKTRTVVGIDPGVTGALAVLRQVDDAGEVGAGCDLPVEQERATGGGGRRHIEPAA